ncbi:MAG: exodeoxyribonuclease VII large subunit [Acidimicrobiales bacterium]
MAMLPLEPTLRVSELLDAVAAVVDDAFDEVWLEGEIRSRRDLRVGGAGPYGARHVYFDLVEPSDDLDRPPVAAISVKLFDSARRRVNAELKRHGSIRMVDGVRVRIRGRVGIYAGRGRVELQMTGIDPGFTLAQLASSRDLVLRALAADGLLDANASLPFPVVPTHIGLVTSAGSAAHADFVHELEVSGLGWRVSLADVRVQGPRAAREVAAAVRELSGRGVDVIAVVRGGGAQTDLAAFDAEIVARAIAGAAVPVLTGIGHEIDTTAADAVAHRAHKTPTACAGSLVATAHAVHRHAEDTWRAVAGSALRRAALNDAASTVSPATWRRRPAWRSPAPTRASTATAPPSRRWPSVGSCGARRSWRSPGNAWRSSVPACARQTTVSMPPPPGCSTSPSVGSRRPRRRWSVRHGDELLPTPNVCCAAAGRSPSIPTVGSSAACTRSLPAPRYAPESPTAPSPRR